MDRRGAGKPRKRFYPLWLYQPHIVTPSINGSVSFTLHPLTTIKGMEELIRRDPGTVYVVVRTCANSNVKQGLGMRGSHSGYC